MRVGILTSVETRHRYFARALRARFDVAAVGYEETGYAPASIQCHNLTPAETELVERHFAERTRQERLFFGLQSDFLHDGPGCRVFRLQPGQLNAPETAERFVGGGVETVIVFGTNLLGAPWLNRFAGRIVNLHLGLSPYYRGTATNFYPLLNEEPQYVGATIHLIDAGIDSGPILAHTRPDITADDQPHTIGCKAIAAGIEKLLNVVPDWHAGRRKPVPQWPVPHPRLYLRKDYHPRHVVALYENLRGGMIPQYVERATHAAAGMRLVD